jgi:hypothetical protein
MEREKLVEDKFLSGLNDFQMEVNMLWMTKDLAI